MNLSIKRSFYCLSMFFLMVFIQAHAVFTPPIDIPSDGFSFAPKVGVDGAGNSVIVFVDVPASNFQVEATQLINGVPTTPHIFPLSINATQALFPNVAVNPSGNAIAAWREQDSSFNGQSVGAFLVNGVWSAPQVFSNIATEFVIGYSVPGVSIDDSGDGLVAWSQVVAGTYEIQWTQLLSQVWQSEQTIFSSTDVLLTPALASNHSGKALAAWFNISQLIVQASYFSGGVWTTTSFPTSNIANTCGLPQLSVAMNSSAEGVIAWMNNNNEIQSVRLVNGVFGPQEILSNASQGRALFQGAAIDPSGNGFVIWTIIDTVSNTTSIQVARLFTGAWLPPQTIAGPYDSSTTFLRSPEVVVDAQGNALATWEVDTETQRQAFAASFSSSNGMWAAPFLLSNANQNISEPTVAANNAGQATVVWTEGNSPSQIQAVIGLVSNPPGPPSNFIGKRIVNSFLTQKDYLARLTWNPSQDPLVVNYLLYRNGQLIATIPASGPYSYTDYNRKKNQKDVYTLKTVNANGVQSTPSLTVVVP